MKILALDIGAGTEDVLLYDETKKSIENCVKMVLPSPSRIFAAKVKGATRLYKDLFISGDIIGGGAFSSALRDHIEQGLHVMMTENAAYTVRNDLDQVRGLGIEIIPANREPEDFRGEKLRIKEVNLKKLEDFLKEFNEPLSDIDIVAVSVQDHGVFPKGMSNRRFRIQKMKELMKDSRKPESLAFKEDEIPSYFLRMKSVALASRRQMPHAKVLVMDTSPAAILGCLIDPAVQKAGSVLAVNVGNGHTMAATISDGKIGGVIEHHTRFLTPQKIEQLLINFVEGEITDEEVFNNGGHGLFYLTEPPSMSKIEMVAATGPNRKILTKTNLSVHFAAPAGDMMMTGPLGLVEASTRRFKLVKSVRTM